MRRVLAIAAAILGVLALFGGEPAAAKTVNAVDVAEWIRDRKPGLRIIDPRTEAEFDEYHLPRAERLLPSATFNPTETIVLAEPWDRGRPARIHPNIYLLHGGMQAWIDEVMNPTITTGASPSARKAFERASSVSRYFGGVPRLVDKVPATHNSVRRRGC
jgi:rhodanese-related sulfurtransferase